MGGPNLGQTLVEDGEEEDEDMDNIGEIQEDDSFQVS